MYPLNAKLSIGEGNIEINNVKLLFSYAVPDEMNHQTELESKTVVKDKLFIELNSEKSIVLKKLFKENDDIFYKTMKS